MTDYPPPNEILNIFNKENYRETTTNTSGITQQQADARYLKLSGGTETGLVSFLSGIDTNAIKLNSSPASSYIMTSDGVGAASWQPPKLGNSIIIEVSPDFQTSTYRKNTIYDAIQQANTFGDQNTLYSIVVYPGTYIEYRAIVQTVSLKITALNPITSNKKVSVFLAGYINSSTTGAWISSGGLTLQNLMIYDLTLIRCDGFDGTAFGLPKFGNLSGATAPAFVNNIDLQQITATAIQDTIFFGGSIKLSNPVYPGYPLLYGNLVQIFSTDLSPLYPYPFNVICSVPNTGFQNVSGALGYLCQVFQEHCVNDILIPGLTLNAFPMLVANYAQVRLFNCTLSLTPAAGMFQLANCTSIVEASQFRNLIDPNGLCFALTGNGETTITDVQFRGVDFSVNVDNTSKLNVLATILNKNSLILANANQALVNLSFAEINTDNGRGANFYGNLSVGDLTYRGNAYLGSGWFNPSTISILRYNGSTFADITTSLTLSNTTPINLFGGSISNSIYIGQNVQFSTIVLNVSSVQNSATIFEYWNGTIWVAFNVMCSNSTSPYTSFADSIITAIGEQEIRFDIGFSGSWQKNTVNSLNKYWIRIRLSSVSVYGQITYLYPSADSTRFNTAGFQLLYGKARYYKNIPFNVNLLSATADASNKPNTQDIYFGTNNWVGKNSNALQSAGRRVGFDFVLPNDFDTSSPLRLGISYISSSTAVQTFTCDLSSCTAANGKLIYTSSAAAITQGTNYQTASVSFPTNGTNGNNLASISTTLYFNKVVPGSLVSFMINRTDAGANSLVFVEISLQYLSFISGSV